MSKKSAKKKAVVPVKATAEATPPKAPEAPTIIPGVMAGTDGTLVHILQQTCSNVELRFIGIKLVQTANEREEAAAQAVRQAQAPQAEA